MSLRERGEQVFYPQLPDTDRPTLAAWTEAIRAELALMRGEKVVVCHSLACAAWLHLAATDAAPADRVLLVSPPGPAAYEWEVIAGFTTVGLDLAELQLAKEPARLACSDDDPYCVEGAAEHYGRPLGCDVDVIPGAGHISVDEGYGPWPSVLDWCLDPETRLVSNR